MLRELTMSLLGRWCIFFAILGSILWPVMASAKGVAPLALDGQWSSDGTRLELSWSKPTKASIADIKLFRRILGDKGPETWRELQPQLRGQSAAIDATVASGFAYEYQVQLRLSNNVLRIGYWAAGQGIPARSESGTALIIVDETIAPALEAHLARFELDLAGQGWQVRRHLVPRNSAKEQRDNVVAAAAIRSWVRAQYRSDPFRPHAVILVGHVPIPMTGRTNPDGHEPRPVPSDLFYAEVDETWLADETGRLRHNAIPSDHIEMPIGRIDFAGLDPVFGSEIDLLKAYFDKNHHWRHGYLGDPRSGYAADRNLRVERNALYNIVGPQLTREGGHHDKARGRAGEADLFGVDFGDFKGVRYADKPPSRAIFAINFGSHKHLFQRSDNPMRTLLAQPWYPLSVAWGGRPAWQLHGMALGETIGDALMRTVNNGRASEGMGTRDYLMTGGFDWINPPWVNLMGDPTLAPFPVTPVRSFSATRQEAGVELSWRKSPYEVFLYRAASPFGPFEALNDGQPVGGIVFKDPNPPEGSLYLARSRTMLQVYAGSFEALGQGVFASPDNPPPQPQPMDLTVAKDARVALNLTALDEDADRPALVSPIRARGRSLQRADNQFWIEGSRVSAGRFEVPFTAFDGLSTRKATANVTVLTAP